MAEDGKVKHEDALKACPQEVSDLAYEQMFTEGWDGYGDLDGAVNIAYWAGYKAGYKDRTAEDEANHGS